MAEGVLTDTQFRILDAVWRAGPKGLSIGELWAEVKVDRDVRRTTVANLVQRLEQRQWLEKMPPIQRATGNGHRYVATLSRRKASMKMARYIVETFFDGRVTSFVMSYLKSKRPKLSHVRQLKKLLSQNQSDQLCRVETEEALRLLLGDDSTQLHDRLWREMQQRYAAMKN